MRRGDSRWSGLLIILAIILLFVSLFAAAYFLTAIIYERIGSRPSPFITQMINSMLGLFFTILGIAGISYVIRSRFDGSRMGVFNPIIAAMQRIAEGDFSVRLDPTAVEDNGGIITELSKSVNNMALELKQMEAMRQEFISNVSHEIQSPLTSIRGFAKALQSNQLSLEERSQYLGIIEVESTRLSRITENLLKLATLEADHVRFEPKPYRLDKQIRELILACEPQWTSKSIDMDVALEEVGITGDVDLLSQVWSNLIHNSIKFTGERGCIGIDLRCRDGEVVFTIKDNGLGISADDQVHVFERFYKADKSRTHVSNSGSGLGLSIAQKIVDMHKGKISLTSQPNLGTTFTVSLPIL